LPLIAAAIKAGLLDSDDWNAWAFPWKAPFTDSGTPMPAASRPIASLPPLEASASALATDLGTNKHSARWSAPNFFGKNLID
jgi:hypothetical protein